MLKTKHNENIRYAHNEKLKGHKHDKDINAGQKEMLMAKLEQRRRMTLRKWNLNPSVKLYTAVMAPRTIIIIIILTKPKPANSWQGLASDALLCLLQHIV